MNRSFMSGASIAVSLGFKLEGNLKSSNCSSALALTVRFSSIFGRSPNF